MICGFPDCPMDIGKSVKIGDQDLSQDRNGDHVERALTSYVDYENPVGRMLTIY